MAKLCDLPNEDAVDPKLVHGIVKFPGKGVVLRNEYNKILVFIPETDTKRQTVIVKVLTRLIADRNWQQPNWAEEFATAP